MWTAQQRYCTACALAVLLGFLLLALYIDPTGLARLNPFSGEECASYEQRGTFGKQQQPHERLSSRESRETGAERDTRDTGAATQDQQSSQGDYYACRLAVYTRQLALFTGALVVATVILIGTGIYQGVHLGRAANAAKNSADALPALERAYIFIEFSPYVTTDMARRLHPVGSEGREPHIDYQFVNHGQTPAIIKAMSAEFGHWTSLPSEIRYIDVPLQAEVVIRSGEVYPAPKTFEGATLHYQETQSLGWELDADEINGLSAGHSFLWFYGHIVYDDVFGRQHETTFCWWYNGLANSFTQYGGRKYNYRT